MKKRIIALALCLAVAPVGSVFGAGSAEDPLISLSYIDGSFIPEVRTAVKGVVGESLEAHYEAHEARGGMVIRKLSPGESLKLSTGQSITLISGSATATLYQGSLVNVSSGKEAESGPLPLNQRHIVCEKSTVIISASQTTTVQVSATAESAEGITLSPFTDVVPGVWWHDDIVKAYERGLVNGMTATTYEPRGLLSISQAVKLAACIHQLYHEGSVSLENSPVQPWYQSYVDYCIENGIIEGEFASYKASATRQQFVEIFHAAMPESEYTVINDIPNGAIGDIRAEEQWVDKVYDFYRAGILTGYTPNTVYNAHDFGANSNITRAEVATILNRMFDQSARQSFTIDQ